MKYNLIFLLFTWVLSSLIFAQGNLSTFNLPPKVEASIRMHCCECKIYDVWNPRHSSIYHFKYMNNGDELHASVDSSGHLFRTYKIVDLNSTSDTCMSLFKMEKYKYDKEISSDLMILGFIKNIDSVYQFQSVTLEYSDLHPSGYYDFIISKLFEYETGIDQKEVGVGIDQKHIKISSNCELLNNDSKKVVTNGDKTLNTYYSPDGSINKVLTATTEYALGKKNGYSIQYFTYPDVIESLSYFEDNLQKGPFFQYHNNGQLKLIGFVQNNISKIIDMWHFDGTKYLKSISYDSITKTYINDKKLALSGRYILDGKEVYFSKGQVDSMIQINKFMNNVTECHDNYIDSIRTLVFRDGDGFAINSRRISKESPEFEISNYNGFVRIEDKSIYETLLYETIYYEKCNFVKEEGAYRSGNKVGKWLYYDFKGMIIKEEEYVLDD